LQCALPNSRTLQKRIPILIDDITQRTATHCNTLQHATRCNTLQQPAAARAAERQNTAETHAHTHRRHHTAHRNTTHHATTLQHAATHCNNLLQHALPSGRVLQKRILILIDNIPQHWTHAREIRNHTLQRQLNTTR